MRSAFMLDLGEKRAAVAEGAAAISRDFYIRWINEPLQCTFGDVVGLRCYQVFAPGRQVPCSPCAMIRILDEGEPFIKFPAVDQQGNPLEVTVTPLSGDEGRGVVLEVARDIRVGMEATIQQQTREYQAVSAELQNIISCSPDMIITTDLNRRIVSFNPGGERILGYKREEVLGRPVEDFWENPEQRQLLLKRLEQEGVISNYETRLRTRDGRLVDVSLSIAELRDEEGRILGTVGISKDITEQKRAQRELERLNENFRQILFFINHELKNALVSICGFANRLNRKLKDEELKKMASTIFQTGLFLERIIDRFLLISRIESGEL
jgi:PAS domain S-box-containing protein